MTSAKLRALSDELHRISDAYSATCTWALTDLAGEGHIGHREEEVLPPASLIKVPILVALYSAVAEGSVALDGRVTYGPEHRCLGSGVLSKMSFGIEMTVRDAAMLMIIISDNSATNMCIDVVGLDYINAQMRALGLRETTVFQRQGDPAAGLDGRRMWLSTAAEMARLFELIGRHEAVSAEASEDMLRILRRQDYRNELSGALPWNEMGSLGNPAVSWVAEKGGSFINGLRAGGAVFHGPNGSFAMSAFCEGGTGQGTGRQSEGNRTLAALGLAAWEALAGSARSRT